MKTGDKVKAYNLIFNKIITGKITNIYEYSVLINAGKYSGEYGKDDVIEVLK
jgi:predicted Mrr-cat superfamily restriction endonuclease